MFISKIHIKNFRNFKNKEICFNDGINVIIGHNNAGKTNLITALSLVIDYQGAKRLNVDDFNKFITFDELKVNPPQISISVTINQCINEDHNSDDLVTVGNWLTKLEAPYEALLTYEFFLPEKEKDKYLKSIAVASDIDKAWKIIKHDFIRLYSFKIFGGDPKLQVVADSDSLQKFDFQFLNAIRDVERDMFTGKNTLLRDVIDFFMDYEIKSLPESIKTKEIKNSEINDKKKDFSDKADTLIKELQERMKAGKEQILSYAKETGASFNKAVPSFEGSISDIDMFSALKLIVEYETGIKIPVTHNGLGYNNLIFMSLLLSKMQVNSDGSYLGSNAKVFPILAIEEPEAHLHPAMQYKFLKFLKDRKDSTKKVRQIFVTTHSTQITSAVSLDEIICLHLENNETTVGYPGKVFPDDKSKKYVQRFLDATKSDMLFAQKVIFVEGLTEQLLIPIFAKYLGKPLENFHIVIINVGGRFFDNFLYLFDTNNPNAINKKIACLTDRDPEKKEKSNGIYEKCYPFECNQDVIKYDYKENAKFYIDKYAKHANIRFFSQNEIKGKTFEYDLILHNPTLEMLVSNSMSNKDEIKKIMKHVADGSKTVADCEAELRASEENKNIIACIKVNSGWNEKDKKTAILAARYLNSLEKGENALELAYSLEENYKIEEAKRETFIVPDYIKEALIWICQ